MVFRKQIGGDPAEGGTYWNLKSWECVRLERSTELPGGPSSVFVRIPRTSILVLAPLMGFAFVVFLPTAGFVMVAGAMLRKIGLRLPGDRRRQVP